MAGAGRGHSPPRVCWARLHCSMGSSRWPFRRSAPSDEVPPSKPSRASTAAASVIAVRSARAISRSSSTRRWWVHLSSRAFALVAASGAVRLEAALRAIQSEMRPELAEKNGDVLRRCHDLVEEQRNA